jgi:CheY-like chemotaxis protein
MAQEHAPDAVVLDIEMPEMDGFEACRQLKGNADTADIPIVMFTVRSEADKVVDFIPKDAFSYNVLLETLRQLDIVAGGLAGIAF